MDTRQISFVDVCDRSDMDELLRDLSSHSNTTLTIDIATETEVLAEPGEYEQLSRAAQSHGVDIELITDDPVRHELARIFGVRALASPSRQTTEVLGPRDLESKIKRSEESDTRRIVDPTEEVALGKTEEIYISRERPRFEEAVSEASFSFVTASATPQSPVYGKRAAPRRDARSARASKSLRAASLVVSGALIVGAIVALLLALLAPTAAITITPEVRQISSDVTYGLAGSDGQLDVAVEPRLIDDSIIFEASIGTTGSAVLPDQPARGLIFLTNPHTDRVLIPEGTVFAIDGHAVMYQSLVDVELPAADPFESARFGTAVVGIEAFDAGPAGNLDVGVLTGTLESGIMFQNRFPLEGGSTKNVPVITTRDIQALGTVALEGLQAQVPEALSGQVPDGWEFSELPAMIGEPMMIFSGEEGAESDTVTIRAEATVAAAVFNPVELVRTAREYLQSNLTAAVPEGFGLLVETIQTSSPAPRAGSSLEPQTMQAVGQIEAQIDQETIEQLRQDYVGKRESQVSENLSSVAGVSKYDLVYGPEWLPWEPIPRFPSRISIDVDGS